MGLTVRMLMVGPLQTNCYVASCEETRDAVVIDPGGDAQRILRTVRDAGLTVRLIVATHAHFDHV
ncbi:MAG TPA: MBL fold metallo-hydrolase, partial [Anaerolineae bacterium]|nr:MBL fold metallo-hydrolase [Anaerolineae bacterium]